MVRLLPLCLLLACNAATDGSVVDSDDTDDTVVTPATRWPACDPSATTQTVSFVHVNDMHGAFNPDPSIAGESPLSRAVGYYKQVQAENPYTVWTDGGDDYEKGSVIEELSGGAATTALVQGMQLDVRALGNHDFSWGEEIALAHSHDDHAQVLASNTLYVGEHPEDYGAVRSVVLEVGCVRIGLFSLNTRPYGGNGSQYDGSYLPGIVENTYDFGAEAKHWVDALKAEGVDLIVGLNHLGMGMEAVVAANAPEVDLLLASHSHTFTPEPVMAGNTRIVQAGSSNNFVIRTDVTFDLTDRTAPKTWDFSTRANLPTLLPVDDAMEAVVSEVFTTYAPDFWEPVAHAERSTGTVSAAALLGRAAMAISGADGAIVDSDYLARGLPDGGLTLQNFFEVVAHEREPPGTPTWSSLWTVHVSGADLQATIDALDGGQAWQGPETLDPGATYTVVLQKRVAEYPELFLLGMPTFSDLTLVGETWKTLRTFGQAEEAACRYLDSGNPIPGC